MYSPTHETKGILKKTASKKLRKSSKKSSSSQVQNQYHLSSKNISLKLQHTIFLLQAYKVGILKKLNNSKKNSKIRLN